MKKKNWYRGLGLADDEYIAEADPQNAVRQKQNKRFISILAACACLALVLGNLWLFIPFSTTPPDVSRYSESEYYGLIQKLNLLTFQPPKYKNKYKTGGKNPPVLLCFFEKIFQIFLQYR